MKDALSRNFEDWQGKSPSRDRPLLRAEGDCAGRIRLLNWRSTAIGPIQEWDPALINALELILPARFPMFLTWGPDQQMFFNDAFAVAFRRNSESMGRPVQDILPEAWPTLKDEYARAIDGVAVYQEDLEVPLLRHVHLNRSWWTLSFSPLRGSSGRIQGAMGVIYDTTRRFVAEQALWSSEAALRVVTDTAPALLWRCDASGRLIWVNHALRAYLGLSHLEGQYFIDWVHPEDRDEVNRAHSGAASEGNPFAGQFRLRTGDDAYRWHLIRAQQVYDGQEITGWCGSGVDIEEWRSAADRTVGDARTLTVAGALPSTMLWTVDLDTRHLRPLNTEFIAAWNIPGFHEGMTLDAFFANVYGEDRPQVEAAIVLVTSGQTAQGKFRMMTPQGVRWMHATCFPVMGEDGTVTRIGGTMLDVTRDVDPRVYVIQSDPASQNALSHAFVRAGFKARTFDDVEAFSRVANDLMPGVVILASKKAFEVVAYAAGVLGACGRHLPWIVMGRFDDQMQAVVQLMKLGAANVLDYDTAVDELLGVVRSALPVRASATDPQGAARKKIAGLSRREREVLDGLLAGGTNKTIAIALSLSPRTVETYRSQLMDRLGVRNLADLLKVATEALS